MPFTRKYVVRKLDQIGLLQSAERLYHSKVGRVSRSIFRAIVEKLNQWGLNVFSRWRPNNTYLENLYIRCRQDRPIKERTILYEAFHGGSISCSPLAIYNFLSQHPEYRGYEHVWVKRKNDPSPSRLKTESIKYIDIHSHQYVEYLAVSKFLVNNSTFPTYLNLRPEQRYINTWHGVPIKKMFKEEGGRKTVHGNSAKNFLCATDVLLPNPYTAEKLFSSSDVMGLIQANVYDNCCPRAELTNQADPLKQKEALGIDASAKVVLYAPTWRGELHRSSDESEIMHHTVTLIAGALPDHELVLSLHNMSLKNLKGISGYHLMDDRVEINEFLSCVDILISDYSSTIFDYFPLNRTTVLYAYDRESYQRTRGLYFGLNSVTAEVAETKAELIEKLKIYRSSSARSLEEQNSGKSSPLYFPHSSELFKKSVLQCMNGVRIENDLRYCNAKKNVVAFMGGLKPNGISTSAINLTKNFDYENYNLVVLTEGGGSIDKDRERQRTLDKFDARCKVVHRVGRMTPEIDEMPALDEFYSTNTCAEKHELALKKLFSREVSRILGRAKVDVAIDFSGYARFWSILLGNSDAQRKVIYQHNDMLSEADSRFKNHLLYGVFHCYKYFDAIVSVSEPTMQLNKSALVPLYPDIEQKLDYVPNCVDAEGLQLLTDVDLKESLGQKPYREVTEILSRLSGAGSLSFVTMGRFSPEKDHAKLLDAFAMVLVQHPDAQLFIIGSGPLKSELIRQMEELNLEDNVCFTGQLENPFPLVKQCSAFVLSSNYEGQPMVLLEALMLNMPVIATDIVGSRSVLGDKYGRLVENTVGGLRAGMEIIITDGYKAEAFDVERYAEETNAHFAEKVLH